MYGNLMRFFYNSINRGRGFFHCPTTRTLCHVPELV